MTIEQKARERARENQTSRTPKGEEGKKIEAFIVESFDSLEGNLNSCKHVALGFLQI
jgi:hypothetical protein